MTFTTEQLNKLKEIVEQLEPVKSRTVETVWTNCLSESTHIGDLVGAFLAMQCLSLIAPDLRSVSPEQIIYKILTSGFVMGYNARIAEVEIRELNKLNK